MLHVTRKKKPSEHHHSIDLLADANGLISGFALYPQLVKVVVTKEMGDLSIATFLIVFGTNIIWFAYGMHRRALPVLLASVLNMAASGILITLFYTAMMKPIV